MSAIIDFFTSIGSVIGTVIDFIIQFISDLVTFVKMLGQAVVKLPQLVALLPAPCVVSFVAVASIAVLYKVLGREG